MEFEQLTLFAKPYDLEDLIDKLLRIGSGFAYGKARIYDQFKKNETDDKNVAFLRNEYGIGGHSWGYDDIDLFVDHDAKGIRCADWNGEINVNLNWKQVAKRIRSAVNSGRYLTQEQYEKIRQEEAEEKEYWKKQWVCNK